MLKKSGNSLHGRLDSITWAEARRAQSTMGRDSKRKQMSTLESIAHARIESRSAICYRRGPLAIEQMGEPFGRTASGTQSHAARAADTSSQNITQRFSSREYGTTAKWGSSWSNNDDDLPRMKEPSAKAIIHRIHVEFAILGRREVRSLCTPNRCRASAGDKDRGELETGEAARRINYNKTCRRFAPARAPIQSDEA